MMTDSYCHDRKSFTLHVLRSKVVDWKQGHEDNEHSQRAVDFLIKKLKSTDGVLDSLAKVLLDPRLPSPCITIPPSVDKRIQIVYRKEFPHVVYCRLWRFPDLQNYHELIARPCCRYPFSPGNGNGNKKLVCINPYHYDRVPSQVLPSIVEPRFNNENTPPTPPPPSDPYLPQCRAFSSWCTITYYEYGNKVGEQFRASSSRVYVDGYTAPFRHFSERFSLGILENVQRLKSVEHVRTSIGHGIELIEQCNGDISIRNRSWSSSIFVQSIVYNRLNGLKDSTVCHLQHRCSIQSIFNASLFHHFIHDPMATYESIHNLTKFCTIYVSFKHGWGYDFGQREITSTPCWLAILINAPLYLIDLRLQQLQPQQATTSSGGKHSYVS